MNQITDDNMLSHHAGQSEDRDALIAEFGECWTSALALAREKKYDEMGVKWERAAVIAGMFNEPAVADACRDAITRRDWDNAREEILDIVFGNSVSGRLLKWLIKRV